MPDTPFASGSSEFDKSETGQSGFGSGMNSYDTNSGGKTTNSKPSVLVTGGTGFLGSYMIRDLLRQGYKVRALKRPNSRFSMLGERQKDVEWVEGDVTDVLSLEKAMQGVEQVYHCSAVVSMRKRDKKQMWKVNAGGTANVVNEALVSGVSKLLHVSSIAAIGRKPESRIVHEDIKWEKNKLNTDYAVSKHLAESEVYRGIAEGLPAIIINPSMIIGAGFWNRGTAAIFRRIHNGLHFYTGGRTGLVDVRDVSNVAIKLMEEGRINTRFIVNGGNMDLSQFISSASKAMNKVPPRFKAGKIALAVAWRLEWLRSSLGGGDPVLTRASAMIANERFEFDNTRLLNELGYDFRPLEQTISETAAAFRDSMTRNLDYGVLSF